MKPHFCIYGAGQTFGSRPAMPGVELVPLKESAGNLRVSIMLRHVHPIVEHKKRPVQKLEQFDVQQVFALDVNRGKVPTRVPTVAEPHHEPQALVQYPKHF